MTFNAKNLNYGMSAIRLYTFISLTRNTDPKEPPFLRRLKGEYEEGDPSRHERPFARPKKHKIPDEDDDKPTYVDGTCQNAISKADYDALMNPKKFEQEAERSPSSSPILQNRQIEEHVTSASDRLDHEVPPSRSETSIGGNSKKKLVKVIRYDGKSAFSSPIGNPSSAIDSGRISKSRKKEKKPKEIKLSFDEDDGK